MNIEKIVEKKSHNIMMIVIASTFSYAKFDEVKDCKIAHGLWRKLKDIYEGDENLRRDKLESLKDQFD